MSYNRYGGGNKQHDLAINDAVGSLEGTVGQHNDPVGQQTVWWVWWNV